MAILARAPARRVALFAFLARELAPREGRVLAVSRIAVATTLTVAIAMVFRIPLAAYMAYLVFLITKDDRETTTLTAVGGALAVTFAVIFTIGLSLLDLGDPALRLPAMALVTFLAMLSVRTFALGPVSFLAGFIIVTMQSVIDEVPNTEIYTRTALWLWVVVLIPVVITVFINLLFGPVAPSVALRDFRKVLMELDQGLLQGRVVGQLAQWRALLQPLVEKTHTANTAAVAASVSPAAIHRLLDVLIILEMSADPLPAAEGDSLSVLIRQCLEAFGPGAPRAEPAGEPPSVTNAAPRGSAAFAAAAAALRDLRQDIVRAQVPSNRAGGHATRPLIVADASSNPAHWQFALKTTLAVMVVYAVYSLLDWPGLRTSIVTCFFVALGSLGETVHKLLLRLSGALIGGALAGLCIVFLLPHLTDIGQLSVLTAAAAALAGWVATSTERLSYAGLQIAFAFFLGILQTDAPATDLTVLRDRVVGIILGNITITVIFSALWPESARTRLGAALADAQRAIAALLRFPVEPSSVRQRTVEALARAEHFETSSLFELQMLPGAVAPLTHLPKLHDLERLAGAAFIVASAPLTRSVDASSLAREAEWLDAAGKATAEGRPAPALPLDAPSANTRAGAALAQLRTEIERVAATA